MKCYSCNKDEHDYNVELVSFGVNQCCKKCLTFDDDNWERIDVDVEEYILHALMEKAHEDNVPFSMLLNKIMREFVEAHEE